MIGQSSSKPYRDGDDEVFHEKLYVSHSWKGIWALALEVQRYTYQNKSYYELREK